MFQFSSVSLFYYFLCASNPFVISLNLLASAVLFNLFAQTNTPHARVRTHAHRTRMHQKIKISLSYEPTSMDYLPSLSTVKSGAPPLIGHYLCGVCINFAAYFSAYLRSVQASIFSRHVLGRFVFACSLLSPFPIRSSVPDLDSLGITSHTSFDSLSQVT